jgi:chemotaxis protein CheD
MNEVEKVGIGQLKVLKGTGVLTAYGLGSCIGLFLYDRTARVGGLAHIMLPGSAPETQAHRNKYADHAVSSMIEQMAALGADPKRIGAVLVGGAHMFRENAGDPRESIGQKNVNGVTRNLKARSIRIAAEDVGGDYGRTVEADVEDGTVRIKSFRFGVREIRWSK